MGAHERGQVLPLIAVFLAAVGGSLLLVAKLGGATVQRAQARTAADAAALAGAAAGEPEARQAAGANGGRLVSYTRSGQVAKVRVRLGDAEAVAWARALPPVDATALGRRRTHAGLSPRLVDALARAERLLGRPVPVTSGFRSAAEQARLWANRFANPFPVAPPGSSAHERGLAIDVPVAFAPTLAAVGPRVGLCQPYPRTDPVHFELCR